MNKESCNDSLNFSPELRLVDMFSQFMILASCNKEIKVINHLLVVITST